MIVRIVEMTFKSENIESFKQLFEEKKHLIRASEGCLYLELLQGKSDERIFMTYSHWESEEALNGYRHSDLFKETWAATKALFAASPRAISMDRLHQLT